MCSGALIVRFVMLFTSLVVFFVRPCVRASVLFFLRFSRQAATTASVRCILFLFEGAGVDTKTKYAFAAIGAFLMAFGNEMIRRVLLWLYMSTTLVFCDNLMACGHGNRPRHALGMYGDRDRRAVIGKRRGLY